MQDGWRERNGIPFNSPDTFFARMTNLDVYDIIYGRRDAAMDWRQYIEQDPEVMMGKPVIKGTRLTVELILEDLGNGATDADLLAAHPRILPEHIRAAQAFAAASLSSEVNLFPASAIK